ncbi:type II toxin-antitoxin system RelE/ParE family toxin [Desulfolutivibrio sulfoxidireducens]|uniref:type II toxin-antitoxin system RelE/ParE family toxin n=1 Tax=Desulfolutivibrio sulfoxidireducens TaxID=2773299 RepID=UPI00159D0F6E|nr:type II toxin-antitoxin system RelE/ParE family toxin [Desulfolutivibrio sulfoxidireducens]QLA17157.1 type II toxin-antitoxin system RelE/ParE family toxin [Desulfolutivibrio sulfoxidireducens]QLA20727.1 type II toxin-antitoxin system RelE/ParE family toxin [Desulfolutivibrio sulfoxidireducens]
MQYVVRRYRTRDGREIVSEWLAGLGDVRARARIVARVARLAVGNFGDCKFLREGVSELRIDYGPGYRVYFGIVDRMVVLLLCGGDKRTQRADVDRAAACLADFKKRVAP